MPIQEQTLIVNENVLLIPEGSHTMTETKIKTYGANSKINNHELIKFDKVLHDFGTIKQGAEAKCEFTIINNSKTPINISDIENSCSCIKVIYSNNEIKPGESLKIEVVYDSKRTGPINKQITVKANNSFSDQTLTLKGFIE
jgi:hypothetical protein